MIDREKKKARVGIDIGGTFTDFALEIDGRRHTVKLLTTPSEPERAVLEGMQVLLEKAGLKPGDLGLIIHGTTLATNALIERKGAKTALVTTEGFRDVLESGFEGRYEQYDLSIDLPVPLVPRRYRFGVTERIDARGKIRKPLDESGVRALVPVLKRDGIEAVAVCFLHSYLNPLHEIAAGNILSDEMPTLSVSLSSVVSPEMREYERFSTTCANAYVQPKMAGYLAALKRGLKQADIHCPLLLMLSSGGITTIDTAARFPVRLVESGPAGGAIFSSHIARQCGYDKVLSFDMGGTTAKVCLIDDYEPQTSRTFEVARVYRFKKGSGLPLRIPVIEMVEIGTGGGSIARVDEMGRVAVGPDSAGSEPGPACYGRGGERPTVTDADVLLGRIDPKSFAGGQMSLQEEKSEAALAQTVGRPLSLPVEFAALGVSEMADESMSNAARVHAVESGKDVTLRTLIAFGGAAPLHVSRVAEKLNVRSFVIPVGAGVGSAVGFLRAPVAYEIVRSDHQRLNSFDAARINRLLAEMTEQASAVVQPAAGDARLQVMRSVFMRYVGQGHEIAVRVPDRELAAESVFELKAGFESEYSRLYSRTVPGEVEALTWVVKVAAVTEYSFDDKLGVPKQYEALPQGERKIFDPEVGKFVVAKVFDRERLQPGAQFRGPAVVGERETTTVISDRFNARVNDYGYLECVRAVA